MLSQMRKRKRIEQTPAIDYHRMKVNNLMMLRGPGDIGPIGLDSILRAPPELGSVRPNSIISDLARNHIQRSSSPEVKTTETIEVIETETFEDVPDVSVKTEPGVDNNQSFDSLADQFNSNPQQFLEEKMNELIKMNSALNAVSSNHSQPSQVLPQTSPSKAQKTLPYSFIAKMKEWNSILELNSDSKLDKDILASRDKEIFKFFGFDPNVVNQFQVDPSQQRYVYYIKTFTITFGLVYSFYHYSF